MDKFVLSLRYEQWSTNEIKVSEQYWSEPIVRVKTTKSESCEHKHNIVKTVENPFYLLIECKTCTMELLIRRCPIPYDCCSCSAKINELDLNEHDIKEMFTCDCEQNMNDYFETITAQKYKEATRKTRRTDSIQSPDLKRMKE